MDFSERRKLRIRRALFFALAILSAVTYHSGLIPEIFFAAPMVMAALCVAVALREKSIPSMAFGALCGALWDLGTTQADGFYTVILAMAGFICGSLSSFFVRNNLFSCLVLTFFTSGFCTLSYWGVFFLRKGYEGAWGLLLSYCLPSVIYTTAFAVVFYYAVDFIVKNTKEKKKHLL